VRELGLSLNQRGVIEISPETAATPVEGVFAGGDCAGGKAFVADAIAAGKMGALSILCFLEGKDVRQEFQGRRIGGRSSFSFQHVIDPDTDSIDLKEVVPFDRINTLCFPYSSRNHNPELLEQEASTRTFSEVAGGLSRDRMEDEISRCFKCGTCTECDLCFLLCPDVSIVKENKGGYQVKVDYCKGCNICATTCPRHVIEMGGGR
jgi:heterodisulfide reductase subunit A-like polyferredoxin